MGLEESQSWPEWKKRAELLQGAWGKVKPGASQVKLPDYFDPELKEIEIELQSLIEQTGQKITTLNGCGIALGAKVLAEVKDITNFTSTSALAKYAGLCPRERSSGKTFRHVKTKSGNRQLNTAIHRIALSQIARSGNHFAKDYFQRKISQGKTKAQALCCLKRRLVDIIYMMLKHKQAYRQPDTL